MLSENLNNKLNGTQKMNIFSKWAEYVVATYGLSRFGCFANQATALWLELMNCAMCIVQCSYT